MQSGVAAESSANFFPAMKTIQFVLLYGTALLLLAMPAPVQAQFIFTTNNGAITITGYTGSGGAVTIPDTTNGLPVTSIGYRAFAGSGLTSVSIGTNVANIGNEAFLQCSSLSTITVSASNPAFSSVAGVLFNRDQTMLVQYPEDKAGSSYEIPQSVTTIADEAFQRCAHLTSVTIPNGVSNLGFEAFEFCGSLTNVTLGTNVTNLGDYTFYGCTSLTQLPIPIGVNSIGDFTFWGCSSLTSVTIPNGVTSVGYDAFGACAGLTNVTIFGTVAGLEDFAFAGCPNLVGVYFLGDSPGADSTVFNDDNQLTAYYLPGTAGWGSTFAGAPTSTWNPPLGSLQVTILPAAAITAGAQWQVDDGTWQGSGATVSNLLVGEHTVSFSATAGWMPAASQTVSVSSNEVATVSGTYVPTPFNCTVSDGVITITGYTGPGGDVTIPDTINGWPVTSIGFAAFESCANVTNLTIGASVTSIGDYAFQSCANLTGVTIGTNVTSIGDYAFAWCASLTNLTIPNSVTNIGETAIQPCPSLRAITVGSSNPAYSSVAGVLFNRSRTTLIEYPAGKAGTQYTIPNSVVTIGNFAFQSCASLTNIVIGASVTSIGGWSFQICAHLTSVTILAGVTNIGEAAFADCRQFDQDHTPASVINIGGDAFEYCYSLSAITVAANNPAYSSVAGVLFNRNQTTLIECPAGKGGGSYAIPNGVTSIGAASFQSCINLTSIKIPNSVTNIGDSAFQSCVSLTNVTIGVKVTSIGNSAFAESGLTSITLGASVTSIGLYAFSGCPSLSAIMVAANNPAYSSVAGVLFNQNQTTLVEYPRGKAGSSYAVPNGVTSIGEGAFVFCDNLTSLTIPASVVSIGVEAFGPCNNLAAVFFLA